MNNHPSSRSPVLAVAAFAGVIRNGTGFFALLLLWLCGQGLALAQGAADIHLNGFEKISERRVSRTIFEYTCRAEVSNTGAERHRDVRAAVYPATGGIFMIEFDLEFGDLLAGESAPSSNTFKFQLDRTQFFDANSFLFYFTVAPPAVPVLTNLTAPSTVVRGGTFNVGFDYADADGDITTASLSRSDALVQQSADTEAGLIGVSGENGTGNIPFNSGVLPFGPAEFTLKIRDSLGNESETVTFTVNVTGEAATGSAPVVTAFTRAAASYDRPTRPYDLAQVRCTLTITDADNDLSLARLRVTGPFGLIQLVELPAADLGLGPSGGTVTRPFFEFTPMHSNGSYTFEVTPLDRNANAGTPVTTTVSLVSSGGVVPRLYLGQMSAQDGAPGSEIDIFGSGFSTAAGSQTGVWLGELPCELISVTANSLQVRIPTGARSGAFTARNPDGTMAVAGQNFVVPEHVAITPTADDAPAVSVGATTAFASVIGSSRTDKSLTWRVDGVAGGNALLGTISPEGVYTAPSAIPANPTVQITASLSADDPVGSPATPVTILPPPETPGSSWVLAAEGATVISTDLRSGVAIPAGALATNATVTARTLDVIELPDAGPGRRTLGAAEFGPPGTVFSSPVTITIPLTVSRPPGTVLRCRFYEAAGGTFVDEGLTAVVNPGGDAALAEITHFSIPVVDEAAAGAPPLTAPTLASISPAEIEEGACLPLRLAGTGLTEDLRVEIRNADGTPAGGMRPETLFPAGESAGFVLDTGSIPSFDSGTRGFKVRLVRSHDDTLFAEIPFTVRGLPEFIVSSGELLELNNPAPLRVSKVSIGLNAVVRLLSGELYIKSLGSAGIYGYVDARGKSGFSANHQTGGLGAGTGGAGGLGRDDADNILGVHSPEAPSFGQHGNDPVGVVDTGYQGPARPLDTFTRAPRGLGGVPGHNVGISPVGLSFNPIEIANLIEAGFDAVEGNTSGRAGLGAPAASSAPTPGGGGGGGGGRFSISLVGLADGDVYGGGGGGGGSGGTSVRIRSARTITGPGMLDTTNPIVDARGGGGGNGSNRSTLRVSLLFGAITLYEDPDIAAFSGGGGGGGRSGTVEITGSEGVFLDSESGRLAIGGGKGGAGGVADIDVDNARIVHAYEASPASNGEEFRPARQVFSPVFPSSTFRAKVVGRALMRLVSAPTYKRANGLVIEITGEGPGHYRTAVAKFNETTFRYEATVLLYPGFNTIVDPIIDTRDPLDAPRMLVLATDTDGDGLTAEDEAEAGTHPDIADTDEDGVNDGGEILAGTNPLVPPAARPDSTFNPVVTSEFGGDVDPGIVNAIAVQPDGKIVIGGGFNTVNGQPRGAIARIETNGSLDSGFDTGGTGLDAPVFCIAVQRDGQVLIGGQFDEVSGQPRYRLARLNADGSVESTATFNPAIGAPGQVNCIAVQPDGKILIGGNFAIVGGQARGGIARLNSNGSLDSSFDPGTGITYPIGNFGDFPGRVYSIAVQADGRILVGGDFTKANGAPHRNFVRLEANGSVESTDPGEIAGDVYAIAIQPDGKILLAGQFTTVGGQPRGGIARLETSGLLESGTFIPTTGLSGAYITSLALQADGKILIGGSFNSVNGQPCGKIARFRPDGSLDPVGGFDPLGGANGSVNALALQADGRIIAGGEFGTICGDSHAGLARLKNDPTTQILSPLNSTYVAWFRGGATPEVSDVSFELSIDNGINWTPLGIGMRVPGAWELANLNLPATGMLRVRGRTSGGENNGSGGLVEQIVSYTLP